MSPSRLSCTGWSRRGGGWSPPTSSLSELHALLLTRLDRRVAARVLEEVDASNLTTVVRVATRDERRARQIVFGYTDKDFSLTDATSFAVMERLRIPKPSPSTATSPSSAGPCWIPLTALESSPTHERARPPLPGQLAAGAIAERVGAPLVAAGACAVASGGIGLITRHYQLLRA